MKPVAAVVAILVLLLASLLAGPFVATAAAAPAPVDDRGPLRLDLTDMSPRVVTADGPDHLTVTGTLKNTGTIPFDDLVVRVQRGDPLQTEGELRDALDGNSPTDAVAPNFVPLTDELAPGASIPVSLTVPLRGDRKLGLALTDVGVHEILVNINGTPRDGAEARLAAIRLLLPVLSLPPDPSSDRPDTPASTPAVPFSMLYPIADVPKRLPTLPGEPVLLADDTLAASFAPAGRLGGLVTALAEQAAPGSRVRAATCVAVDPDLVETALAMKGTPTAPGYQFLGPDGVAVPGTGAAAASAWLDRLGAVARGGCLLALPYADADLVALTRGGLGTTAAAAIDDGRKVLASALGAAVLPTTTWPVDGVADEPTLDMIAGAGSSAVVLSADGLEQNRTRRSSGVVPIAGTTSPLTAVLTDPLLTLAAAGPDPTVPVRSAGVGAAALPSTPAGSGTPLATQDTIGALTFRAQDAAPESGAVVLAPPHDWAAEGTGAAAMLKAVGQLIDAGRLAPRSLGDAVAQGAPSGTAARPPVYPTSSGGQEIRQPVIASIRTGGEDLTDLRSAVVDGSGVGIPVDDVFVPLRRGLVRPASAALRGLPEAAQAAADRAANRIRDIRGTVRVLEPPTPYSLGTSDAPLPLTIVNGLPVTVRVIIELSSTSGLKMAAVPVVEVPPAGRRQVSANAQVTRSGQFTVYASVRSPNGGLLGPSSQLSVRSTAYGTITVWLTASAGVLLVLLAGRRVLRRIRGEPGRHSGTSRTTSPNPTPIDPNARINPEPAAGPAAPGSRPPQPPDSPGHRTGDPFPPPTPQQGLPTQQGPGPHQGPRQGSARPGLRPLATGPTSPGSGNGHPAPNGAVRHRGSGLPAAPQVPSRGGPIPAGPRPARDQAAPRPQVPILPIPASPIPGTAPTADRVPAVEDLAATDRFPAKQPGGSHPEPPPVDPRTPTHP
ncbi:DUF6049 family protein [Pseudonocardia sp. GCM10023141]|uniref:DUF6049 family protein n=1 Tax=Pseudonocardia sp. GCM10023141 TaxID=3252653 RepID=UPI00360DD342